MLSVTLLLTLAALVCALWPKADLLRVAVVLLVVVELLRLLPR